VNAIGKAELRGSTWNARNVGETPITEDQRCRVESVDGLTLSVRG
jgi:membrane protein implicated in regulation of membrane protease activity